MGSPYYNPEEYGTPIEALDEGVSIANRSKSFNFTGAGVTASAAGDAITVNIAGAPAQYWDRNAGVLTPTTTTDTVRATDILQVDDSVISSKVKAAPSVANTLVNPGFETWNYTESADNWSTLFPGYDPTKTADSHSGNWAALTHGGGDLSGFSAGVQAFVGLTPGDDYQLDYWAKGAGKTVTYAYLQGQNTFWNFTAGTWDDIAPNFLVDGGLEIWTNPTTLTNWTFFAAGMGSPTLDQEAGVVYSGTFSAKITPDAGTMGGIQQAAAGVGNPGDYIQVSGYSYGLADSTGTILLLNGAGNEIFNFMSSTWEAYAGGPPGPNQASTFQIVNSTWTQFSTSFNVATDQGATVILLSSDTTVTYLDDIVLNINATPGPDYLHTDNLTANYAQYTSPAFQVLVPASGEFSLIIGSVDDGAYLDDVTLTHLGSDVIVNGGFENWTTTYTSPGTWTSGDFNGSSGTVSRETGTVHGGSVSIKLTNDALNAKYVGQLISGLTLSDSYQYKAWTIQGTAGDFVTFSILNDVPASATQVWDFTSSTWVAFTSFGAWSANWDFNVTTGAAWANTTIQGMGGQPTVPASNKLYPMFRVITNGGVAYFDDMELNGNVSGTAILAFDLVDQSNYNYLTSADTVFSVATDDGIGNTKTYWSQTGDGHIFSGFSPLTFNVAVAATNLSGTNTGDQNDHGTLTGLSDLDHPASAIINTPAGNIAATDVQSALNELDTEKAPIDSPVFTTQITTPIVYGSVASGGDLTLYSTSHATKGKIKFGTSAYDEVNNRLGIGTDAPAHKLDVQGSVAGTTGLWSRIKNTDASGYALIGAMNSADDYALFTCYGASYSVPFYAAAGAVATKNNLILATNGAVSSGGTGKMYFMTGGYDATITTRGNISAAGNWYLGLGTTDASAKLHVVSAAADGASAVAAIIDTSTTWSTAGAKLLSVRNNTSEKAYIDKDGIFTGYGLTLGAGKIAIGQATATYDIDILRSSGNAKIMTKATTATAYAQNLIYAGTNGIALAAFGSSFAAAGVYAANTVAFQSAAPAFNIVNEYATGYIAMVTGGLLTTNEIARFSTTGLSVGTTSSSAWLHSVSKTADGASAVAAIIDTSTAWSNASAKLLSVRNNTAEKAYIDYAGIVSAAGLALGTGNITMSGSIGVTGTRITKGWFTDLEVTNAIAGSITGNAATLTVADEAADTTCFVGFYTAASGSLAGKTNTNLTFNASTGVFTSASAVLTTADINGGTLDGVTIGGASAAAATVTTLTIGGDITTAAARDWDLVDNNASALSFDATGKAGILEIVTTDSAEGVKMSGTLSVGTAADNTFITAKILSSTGITGYGLSANIGTAGEAVSTEDGLSGVGIFGIAKNSANYASFGVYGIGYAGASGNTAAAYGGYFYSQSTHVAGDNVGVYASAVNGANNYSFYGAAGRFYNAGNTKLMATDLNAATLTLTAAHHVIQCRYTSTGTCTITLPAISAMGRGTEYIIIDSGYNAGTNNITIARNGADKITNLSADYVLNTNGSTVRLVANTDTANWEII